MVFINFYSLYGFHSHYFNNLKISRKMRNLLHTLLLLTFFTVSISLTSCLNSTEDEITYYSDCSITTFSLGSVNRYTKTTSSTGKDSIVKTVLTGSQFKIAINQTTHEIYNVDSLPAGTDSLHVICNIGAKNGGYVYFKDPTSDLLTYHNTADSVSFKTNPRTVVIISNDGQYKTEYTVKLNIHKEYSDKMTWNAPVTEPSFADADELQCAQWQIDVKGADGKTTTKDSIVAKVAKGGNVMLYAAPVTDRKTWTAITPDVKLSAKANIASIGGVLYSTDENGQILQSADGKEWTPFESLTGNVLGISNNKLYYVSGSVLNAYNFSTKSTAAEPFYGFSAYPFAANTNAFLCEITKNGKATGTSIVGFEAENVPAVMYKAENTAEQQMWMMLLNESDQNLPAAYTEVVSYGQFLVALSEGKIISSLDRGRSWQSRYYFYPPKALPAEGKSHIFADSHGILWIFAQNGQVFTGKLNQVAWER